MEMSDGIDFETWVATVRSLASAVDRLERTVTLLAAPAWAEPLLAALGEFNLHLRRHEEANLWFPYAGNPQDACLQRDKPEEAPSGVEAGEEPACLPEVSQVEPAMNQSRSVPWDGETPPTPVRFGDRTRSPDMAGGVAGNQRISPLPVGRGHFLV